MNPFDYSGFTAGQQRRLNNLENRLAFKQAKADLRSEYSPMFGNSFANQNSYTYNPVTYQDPNPMAGMMNMMSQMMPMMMMCKMMGIDMDFGDMFKSFKNPESSKPAESTTSTPAANATTPATSNATTTTTASNTATNTVTNTTEPAQNTATDNTVAAETPVSVAENTENAIAKAVKEKENEKAKTTELHKQAFVDVYNQDPKNTDNQIKSFTQLNGVKIETDAKTGEIKKFYTVDKSGKKIAEGNSYQEYDAKLTAYKEEQANKTTAITAEQNLKEQSLNSYNETHPDNPIAELSEAGVRTNTVDGDPQLVYDLGDKKITGQNYEELMEQKNAFIKNEANTMQSDAGVINKGYDNKGLLYTASGEYSQAELQKFVETDKELNKTGLSLKKVIKKTELGNTETANPKQIYKHIEKVKEDEENYLDTNIMQEPIDGSYMDNTQLADFLKEANQKTFYTGDGHLASAYTHRNYPEEIKEIVADLGNRIKTAEPDEKQALQEQYDIMVENLITDFDANPKSYDEKDQKSKNLFIELHSDPSIFKGAN